MPTPKDLRHEVGSLSVSEMSLMMYKGGVIPASSGRKAGLTPLRPLFVSTEEIGGARKLADV
jgi:hypothetical protein